jgi:uncharacterized membrane protein (UPF0127 family)
MKRSKRWNVKVRPVASLAGQWARVRSIVTSGFFLTVFLLLSSIQACDSHSSNAGSTGVSTAARAQSGTTPASGPRVVLPDGFAVSVEVAADDSTRTQGLMFRDRLAEDRGMLFLFPATNEYAFWMKNTLIPLDMVWLDEQQRIVHVSHDVPPCKADPCPSYPPGGFARSVLELAAGTAVKHRVTDGAVLRISGLEGISPR